MGEGFFKKENIEVLIATSETKTLEKKCSLVVQNFENVKVALIELNILSQTKKMS